MNKIQLEMLMLISKLVQQLATEGSYKIETLLRLREVEAEVRHEAGLST